MSIIRLLRSLCFSMLPLFSSNAFAQGVGSPCGDINNAYGPYDYRSDRDKLPIVEGAHFTNEVELLIKGKSSNLGGDIDYTLRAFPNHHRALISIMRLAQKTKSPQPPGARYTVECYFDRAIRFKPQDSTVRMIFATYLHKANRDNEARQQVDFAATLAGDNALTHNNLGLLYLELKNYDSALQQAHLAMALGLQRTELRNALKAAGKWIDPPLDAPGPEPTASGATSASPAPSSPL